MILFLRNVVNWGALRVGFFGLYSSIELIIRVTRVIMVFEDMNDFQGN
jgi:hypothetical protein